MEPLEILGIIQRPFSAIINGKSGSGKSHVLRYIMREISKSDKPFDYGVVMSNTAWEGSFDYIPKKYIYEDFNEDVIKNLIKLQKNNLEKKIQKQAFIILDDCCSENEFTNNVIKKLFVMGRHYNISTILTTQYVHLVPPVLRSNSFYNLFFNIGEGYRELQSVYQAYGGRFTSYSDFKEFYYNNIRCHKFIMWNCQKDNYQVYRVPQKIPYFKLSYNNKF